MLYSVTLQTADGAVLDVAVAADTDEKACAAALREAVKNGRDDLRCVRAVPAAWRR